MGVIRRYSGRGGRHRWQGVAVESYPDPSVQAVTKQVVVGQDDGARNYSVRYFEIAPGGCSSLDRHAHDHAVVILTGSGRARLGEETHAIGFGDVVYIGPEEVHQFENTGAEPLGFLCVASRKQAAD